MSDTDPLAPSLGASDPTQPAQAGQQRTLRGALATAVVTLGLFALMAAPTAVLLGALLVPAVLGVVALGISHVRRRSRTPTEVRVPGTDRCLRV